MKLPAYIIDFIIKHFDEHGTYVLGDFDREECKWLFQRGLMKRWLGQVGLVGEIYNIHQAMKWNKKGFVAIVQ